MAWYRKYRPQQVAELDIQEVRESLQSMFSAGKLPQVLLFAGPKGTGKTSTARILAATLNDPINAELVDSLFLGKKIKKKGKLQFKEADPQSDFAKLVYQGKSFVVQELDAASNRRIDDVRQLRERLYLPPNEGKMTVYILDEVHMLTTEAFNALLKILEEPPEHVVFILATTEIEKVPDTVRSRCTILPFRKAKNKEIITALERICQAEKLSFQSEDLEAVAERADGSFRDAVKLLEQAVAAGKIDLKLISSQLSFDNQRLGRELIELIMGKEEEETVLFFEDLRKQNRSENDFLRDLLYFLHRDLLRNYQVEEGEAEFPTKIDQFFLKEFLEIEKDQSIYLSFLALELKSLEIINRSKKGNNSSSGNDSGTSGAEKKQKLKNQSTTKDSLKKSADKEPLSTPKKVLKKDEELIVQTPSISSSPELKVDSVGQANFIGSNLQEAWAKLIDSLRESNFSLTTLLKSCKVDAFRDSALEIFVYYSFHKERLEQMNNKDILEKKATEIFGTAITMNFHLAEVIAQHSETEGFTQENGLAASTEQNSLEEETFLNLAKEALI